MTLKKGKKYFSNSLSDLHLSKTFDSISTLPEITHEIMDINDHAQYHSKSYQGLIKFEPIKKYWNKNRHSE